MKKGVILLLASLAFIIFFVHTTYAATNVTACGTLNSANTVYDLQNNITNASFATTSCFIISAQNITFNGNGYTLIGNRSNFGVYVLGGNGSIVENLKLDNFTYGIYVPFSASVQILHNTVNGSLNVGIYVPIGVNTTISNNTVTSSTSYGIYVPTMPNSIISHNSISSTATDGIQVANSQNSLILNNTVVLSTGRGMYLNSQNITLINNTFSNNTAYGLYILVSTNVTALNTVTRYNNLSGIGVVNSTTITLTNNTANSNTLHGFYILGSNFTNVLNNTATSNSLVGAYLNLSLNSTVTYNTLSDNSYNGMSLTDTNSTNATGNLVNSNGGYGIAAVGSGYNIIQYNNVNTTDNNDNIAVHTSIWTVVQYNNATYGASNGINVQDGSFNTVAQNTVTNNNASGILLTTTNNNNVTNNTITSNLNGLRLWSSNYSYISSNTIQNSTVNGIQLIYASVSNNFSYLTILSSGQNAINLNDTSNNNLFTDVRIQYTNSAYQDVVLSIVNGTRFVDIPYIGNYSFVNASVSFENSSYGLVQFFSVLNVQGVNFTSDVAINQNDININASNSVYNIASNVSIYGTPGSGKTSPYIARGSAHCTDCYNNTALTETIVNFNATQGGEYSIKGISGSSGGGSSNRGASHASSSTGESTNTTTYHITNTQFENGYTQELREGEEVTFDNHKLSLDTIDETSVQVTVSSTPQTLTLTVGESKMIDLDNDQKNDLSLRLNSVNGNVASLYIAKIVETPIIPTLETNDLPETTENPLPPPSKGINKLMIIGGIFIVVILVIAFYFVRKRNLEH